MNSALEEEEIVRKKEMEQSASLEFGRHASATYQEVSEAGEPMEIDAIGEPVIYRGERKVRVRVIPADGSDVRIEEVYLKRSSSHGRCPQVYRRIKSKLPRKAQHDGLVIQALRMECVEGYPNLFQEPTDTHDRIVAIKKQSLVTIKRFIDVGHHENPYNAIALMQQIGDDEHVLGCIEALRDDKNLYTIMKYCDGGILSMLLDDDGEHLHRIPESKARDCMTKVWWNLHYLQKHGIVHHDLSPDNIMSLHGKIVFTDLAMSLRIRGDPNERRLLRAQGRYGKDAYMSPEVFISDRLRVPFDGFGLDLWASACILYNLVGGQMLFYQPFPADVLFKYFVMAKGLSNAPLNSRTIEITLEVFQSDHHTRDRQPLLTRAMANIQLSPSLTHLLEHMLDMNPANRFTLAQCLTSNWAQGIERLW